jgi:hypothetical protein
VSGIICTYMYIFCYVNSVWSMMASLSVCSACDRESKATFAKVSHVIGDLKCIIKHVKQLVAVVIINNCIYK